MRTSASNGYSRWFQHELPYGFEWSSDGRSAVGSLSVGKADNAPTLRVVLNVAEGIVTGAELSESLSCTRSSPGSLTGPHRYKRSLPREPSKAVCALRRALRRFGPPPHLLKARCGSEPEDCGDNSSHLTTPAVASGEDHAEIPAAIENHVEMPEAMTEAMTEHNDDLRKLFADFGEVVAGAVDRRLPPRGVSIQIQGPKKKRSWLSKGPVHELFPTLLREIGLGNRVFLSGPPGSGKSRAVRDAAAALGYSYYHQPSVTDEHQVLGYTDASGAYVPSTSYKWITDDGPALLFLDEVDASSPASVLSMNALLEEGIVAFPHEQIEVPSDKVCVAAANTWGVGASLQHNGRQKLDDAFLNRFTTLLEWGFDERLEERVARMNHGGTAGRVQACQRIRKHLSSRGVELPFTPRDTNAYCRRRYSGVSHVEALQLSRLQILGPEEVERIAVAYGAD